MLTSTATSASATAIRSAHLPAMYGSMLYDVHITLLASSGIERAGCLPIRFSFSEDSQGEVALSTVCTFGSHAVNLLTNMCGAYHWVCGRVARASWRLPDSAKADLKLFDSKLVGQCETKHQHHVYMCTAVCNVGTCTYTQTMPFRCCTNRYYFPPLCAFYMCSVEAHATSGSTACMHQKAHMRTAVPADNVCSASDMHIVLIFKTDTDPILTLQKLAHASLNSNSSVEDLWRITWQKRAHCES
jgi:hypothetical protein